MGCRGGHNHRKTSLCSSQENGVLNSLVELHGEIGVGDDGMELNNLSQNYIVFKLHLAQNIDRFSNKADWIKVQK